MQIEKLTDNERAVLTAWKDCDEETCVLSFARVSFLSNFDKPVRRYVRSLARKGLLEFSQVSFSIHGEVCGAGYMPTKRGWEAVNELRD